MIYKFKVEYVSYEELYAAYLDCRKRKRNTVNASEFEIDLNKNLYKLWRELNGGTYEIGVSIVFLVDRPVVREVYAACFRDRIVHHLIVKRINATIEKFFIFDTYSCRVGKGTLVGVKRCYEQIEKCTNHYTEDAYILKCDLKSFFMTISKLLLYELLVDFLRKNYKCSENERYFNEYILKKIIYHCPQQNCVKKPSRAKPSDLPKGKSLTDCPPDRGLPIGNLSSQIFANFFMSYFDHYVKEVLGFEYYGRYVDDFYIIHKSKEKLIESIPLLREKLAERGIILHPKKLYIQHYSKGVKFIGAVIKPGRLYIANRTKGNFYESILKLEKIYLSKQYITITDMEHCCSVINSYLGFLKHYKSRKIKNKMLSLQSFLLWYRFLAIYKNKSKIGLRYCIKKEKRVYNNSLFCFLNLYVFPFFDRNVK